MSSLLPHSPIADLLGFSLLFIAIGANRIRVATKAARRARHDEYHTVTEDGTEFRRIGPRTSPPPRVRPKGRP